MKNNYVLEHDFGYGRDPEIAVPIKLDLRNINDLNVYIEESISALFVALVKNKTIHFLQDNTKTKILIEKI